MNRRIWIPVAVVVLAGLLAASFLLGRGYRSSSEDRQQQSESRVEAKVARAAALVNYENSVTGCETRGNELRGDVLILGEALAAAERPELYVPGRKVVHNLKTAEYSRPDGTIECRKAIEKP